MNRRSVILPYMVYPSGSCTLCTHNELCRQGKG